MWIFWPRVCRSAVLEIDKLLALKNFSVTSAIFVIFCHFLSILLFLSFLSFLSFYVILCHFMSFCHVCHVCHVCHFCHFTSFLSVLSFFVILRHFCHFLSFYVIFIIYVNLCHLKLAVSAEIHFQSCIEYRVSRQVLFWLLVEARTCWITLYSTYCKGQRSSW